MSEATSIQDAPSYITYHNDLQDLIASLGDRLGDVTHHYEEEFLAAYRIHQISIHEELKMLRDRVAKAEETLFEDSAVARMEEECSWFRSESDRLQSHVSAMMKDLNTMNTRLKELREQRAYLSDQLKAVMKRSRVYGAEIDYIKDKLMTTTSTSMSLADESNNYNNKLNDDKNNFKNQKSRKKTKKQSIDNNNSGIGNDPHNLKTIEHTKQKYDNKIQEMIESKTGWDNILENVIDLQFQKIIERKTFGVLRSLRTKADIQKYTGDKAAPGYVPPAFAHEIPKINGLTGLGVEHFNEIDKFQAMVSMLSQPEIFRNIVKDIDIIINNKNDSNDNNIDNEAVRNE